MKKIGIIIFFIFVFQKIVFAQSDGFFNYLFVTEESGGFLKIPVSPRASAMGDSFVALADDAHGIYYNPAGIVFMKKPTLSLGCGYYEYDIDIYAWNETEKLVNFRPPLISFVYPFKNWGIGLSHIGYKYDMEPFIEYWSGITPISFGAGFGNFGIGFSVKKYYEETLNEFTPHPDDKIVSGTTVYDYGYIYNINKFRFGIALQNFGGKVFDYKVVKIQRYGAAYVSDKYLLTVETKKESDKIQFGAFGGEYSLTDFLKLRAGFNAKKNFEVLTFGFGANFGRWTFDFASLIYKYEDFGVMQKVGLSYGFGKGKTKEEKKPEQVVKPSVEPKVTPVLPVTPKVVKSIEAVNIAVADFTGKNVSQADASIIADFLRTELVTIGVFNVMDRNNMEIILAEQKFQVSGCTEQECAVEMGKLLNVQNIVIGSLSKLLETYYITVNLIDVQTGKIIASYDEKATSADELKQACKTLAQKLSRR